MSIHGDLVFCHLDHHVNNFILKGFSIDSNKLGMSHIT